MRFPETIMTLNRRRLLAALPAAAGVLSLSAQSVPALAATPPGLAILDSEAVYFEETGHTASGAFWRHWRVRGLDAYGYPISAPFQDNGVTNQYFQRARFERTPEGTVRLGLLGVEAGGTEPAQPTPTAAGAAGPADPDARVIPETGHVVQGAFRTAYERWQSVLGPPIGPEQAVSGGYIQYFANGRLEWDPFGGVRLGLLGAEIAGLRRVNTAPAAPPAGAVKWSEVVAALVADQQERSAFGLAISGNPDFVPDMGEKWVAVSIPRQRVTAYEHTQQVFTDLCSTGQAAKGLTPRGMFAINRRVPNEIMDSTSIGYPAGHPKYYRLENVLYTQYFDNTGTALHYAWWHNNFGQPMSYGCVNLRLTTAKWFWDWATIGTRVIVA